MIFKHLLPSKAKQPANPGNTKILYECKRSIRIKQYIGVLFNSQWLFGQSKIRRKQLQAYFPFSILHIYNANQFPFILIFWNQLIIQNVQFHLVNEFLFSDFFPLDMRNLFYLLIYTNFATFIKNTNYVICRWPLAMP